MENVENNDYVEISSVRIYPSRLEFCENADRKGYKSKFIIQNIGKGISYIRVLESPSKYYKVKSIPKGQSLSPGLRIIIPVEIPYSVDEKPNECLVPIFINDKRHDYLIILKPAKATIIITPEILDFGTINAGTIHISKTVIIENKAFKDMMFHVDRSMCDSAVIVDPIRGRIRVDGIFEISVKIFSIGEAVLDTCFTIKCGYLLTCIRVKGEVINSKLQALHPNTTEHFTLLEFPPTYYGLSSVVNLFVRNYSAIPMMYSTMGEIRQKRVNFASIKKESINFQFFDLYPTNGFFHENETKLFIFQFSPRQIDLHTKFIRFYFCTILMHRFRSASLAYQGDFISDLSVLVTTEDDSKKTSIQTSLSQIDASDSFSSIQTQMNDRAILMNLNPESPTDFARIHLYATAEIAEVDIVPNEICIKNLEIHKCVKRVLLLTNKSKNLPIILQYKKVPYIFVSKENFTLGPSEKLEISINIQPSELGFIETEVGFNLMYYNFTKSENDCKVIGESKMVLKFNVKVSTKYPKPQLNPGLKPNYIKDVGKHCQNIKFNTKIDRFKGITVDNKSIIDKNCEDLVSFPNDTQRSIRPYRAKQTCRTIFTKQERYQPPLDINYELPEAHCSFKRSIRDYYFNYLQSEFKKLTSPKGDGDKNSEYQITLMYKVLCEDLTVRQPPLVKYQKPEKVRYYVPLIPQEMDNIIISPPVVHTGQIANNNIYTFNIKIENNNNVPIRILLKSDKFNLIFAAGARRQIDPFQCSIITMSYKTTYVGYYSTNLYVIINESAAHTVPILAEVVANVLHISKKPVVFTNTNLHQYIELTNKLNVPIPFSWLVIDNNFAIDPISGIVRPGKKFTCTCRFFCTISGPRETEAQLYCGDTMRQKIKLESQIKLTNVSVLDKELNFGEIPLNEPVMRSIVIKNFEIIPLSFSIVDYENLTGLSITPLTGILQPSTLLNIYVTAKFPACVKFNYTIKINTVGAGYLDVSIKGTVIYPNISFNPNIFNFPKIPASSTTLLSFSVKNESATFVRVKIDLTEYEEFKIMDIEDCYETSSMEEITLNSKEVKTLYMKFEPSGAQRSQFYLPIIINNILGPPIIFDTISTKVNYHFTTFLDNCEYIDIPEYLPCIKVQTLATPPKIVLSKTFIELIATCNHRNVEYKLSIKNTQSESEDICIRIDNLKEPVFMEYLSGVEVNKTECAYVITLPPDEITWFRITFKPEAKEFSENTILLPVYLHSDNSLDHHCIINIHAIYERPVIIALNTKRKAKTPELCRADNQFIYYMEPSTPFNGKIIISGPFLFINHLPDCKISTHTVNSLNKFYVEVFENTKTDEGKDSYSVWCSFIRIPDIECVFNVSWVIECSCGGRHVYTTEGIIENCLFTCYSLLYHIFDETGNKEERTYDNSSYPFFPRPSFKHYSFIEACAESVESWLGTQIFFGQCRYDFPYSINFAILEPPPAEALKRQTQLSRIPILHLLGNLVGPNVLSYLQPSESPTNELEAVQYMHFVYSRTLELLKTQEAYIGYIRPEYLFLYYDFCIYKRELFECPPTPYPLTVFVNTFEDFQRLSKQSWLDLLLQIYKTLYLNKLLVKYRELGTMGKLQETPLGDFYEYIKDVEIKTEFYGRNVAFIFSWLEYNYKKNVNKIWTKIETFKEYKIGLFNCELSDGIIFAVSLATYCPYLIPYLQNIYLEPSNPEEIYHNAAKLVECLEMINYSFKITIEQIVYGCAMKTFMLAVYLFEILPYMYPKDKIIFETGLSTTTSRKIEIYNENTFPISYKIIFIGNDRKCFSVGKENFEIPPKKAVPVTIYYMARFIKQLECTLVLSGECSGYRYASNKAITLIGIPILNHPSSVITHTNELYKSKYMDFTVQSPYKVAARYKMQQTHDAVHKALELSNVIYHLEKDRIACTRLIPLNESFNFDQNGLCVIHSVTATIMLQTISTWLYFTNEKVGDFAIQVISKVKDSTEREILYVNLPRFIDDLKDRPDSLFINIPKRNELFFKAIKTILVQITEGYESELWQKITNSVMGANILESLFTNNVESSVLIPSRFSKRSSYIVTMSENANVILPDTIEFEDEYIDGFCKIPVVLKNVEDYPNDFDLTLESRELRRKRFYTVRFVQK